MKTYLNVALMMVFLLFWFWWLAPIALSAKSTAIVFGYAFATLFVVLPLTWIWFNKFKE